MKTDKFLSIRNTYTVSQGEETSTKILEISEVPTCSHATVMVGAWSDNLVEVISLDIEKELYKPNHIVGKLMVKSNDESLSDIIITSLLEGTIDVYYYDENDSSENKEKIFIAQDYLIHEVRPTVHKNTVQFITVDFEAFSPDVMLTYDRYSVAHTAKRLCKNIIPNQLDGILKDVFPKDMMRFGKLHNTVSNDKEIIVPYLVQYNESFYDFLRRVSYRSGEYLFFENGKLNIGLDIPVIDDKTAPISYVSKSGKGRYSSKGVAKSIVSHHHNLNEEESKFASAVAFNEEYSQEEYTSLIKHDPNEVEYFSKGKNWISAATGILSKPDLADMSLSLATGMASGYEQECLSVSNANKEFNEDHLFTKDKKENAEKYDKQDESATCYYPYMMYDSLNNLICNAYREVREGEAEVRNKMQHLELDYEKFENIRLGQIIKIDDQPTLYVVVKVELKQAVNEDRINRNYNINIAPLYSDSGRVFPPKQDDIETVRYVGPQTAFITSTKDALEMGRVQIRYHWQTNDGDATPLIRLSSQMASSDAGVQFMPNKGDEVIINFTNGNVELPYVAGALFNMAHKAPESTRTIRSSHGHSITFNDKGEDLDFAKSIAPMIGIIDKKINPEKKKDENAKFHTGGITMADDCGFYMLDLNATKRSITINSPMGKVEINALTGIKISAPNGDVSISGKNVKIEAGNNLTISAGGNIKKLSEMKEKFTKDSASETIIGTAFELADSFTPESVKDECTTSAPIDMKAIRCIFECFAKPMEGSLKIHSENNLFLESGGKKTSADMSSMQHNFNQQQVCAKRSTMVAAGIKTVNDIFAELTQMLAKVPGDIRKSKTNLENYLKNDNHDANIDFAIKGLMAKLHKTTAADIISKLEGDVSATPAKIKYEEKDTYSQPTNRDPSLEDIEAMAETIFKTNPGDNTKQRTTFNQVILAKGRLKEIKKLNKLVNAYTAALTTEPFKKKGKELKGYSKWFLGTSAFANRIGLDKNFFTDLGTFVEGIKYNGTKFVEFGGSEVDADSLKVMKREALYKIMVAMTEGNGQAMTFVKTLLGGESTNMAYYSENNGIVANIATLNLADNEVWSGFVDKFEECKDDDVLLAKVLNQIGSQLDDKMLGSTIADTWSGAKGIFTEACSLATEAQGNIYLTANDKGTSKVVGTTLEPTSGIKSKFDDIKEALKL